MFFRLAENVDVIQNIVIANVEEFQGPVGSESYRQAEKRMLNYLGIEKGCVSFQASIELPASLS